MPKVSENTSEKVMSVAEATTLMREIVRPLPVKTALGLIADELKGWTANRIRDVWHADPRVALEESELEELRAAAQRKREAAGAAEYRALRNRLDRMEAALRTLGADLDLPGDDLGSRNDR